ncbi:MAG: hypothetical protein QY332_12020 [Anaerolineales bacterium]|nr:MAG: hypothetical protein QY332_12020 [Anaerolineales bacterium]
MAKGERTFRANIATLHDELIAAHQWSRPSIIIAICNDHWVQKKAMTILGEKFKKSDGLSVVDFNFFAKTPDIIHHFMDLGEKNNSIVFSYNLDQPGREDEGIAYRALNMQREYFVEEGIKLLLWLNPHEASLLPNRAPDFWAFRHLVVIFSDAKMIPRVEIGSRLMLWHDGEMNIHPSELNSKININMQALSKLPDSQDAISSRISLHQQMAHLYWSIGDQKKSLGMVETGLKLTTDAVFSQEHIFFLNILSVIHHARNKYAEAEEVLKAINEQNGYDPIVMMNYAIALVCNGKRRLAMVLAKKAVEIDLHNPILGSRLAYLSLLTGKISDAIQQFEEVLMLDPRAEFKIALLICKQNLKRLEQDGVNALIADNDDFITKACLLFLTGEREIAINTLSTAAELLKISRDGVLTNPNLWLLMNPNDFPVDTGAYE